MANIEITICVFEVSNSFLSKSFNGHLKTESILILITPQFGIGMNNQIIFRFFFKYNWLNYLFDDSITMLSNHSKRNLFARYKID